MSYSQAINGYVKQVKSYVKWKKAHYCIEKELRNHIDDQAEAYIEQGIEEDEAYNKAIKSMGKAKIVGERYNSTYKPNIEWSVIALIATMFTIGFVMRMFFISHSDFYELQLPIILITAGLGSVTLYAMFKFDFTLLAKKLNLFYILLTGFTILLFLLTSKSWSIELVMKKRFYSTFVMLLYPALFAGVVFNQKNKGFKGIVSSWLYIIIPLLLSFCFINTTCALILLVSFVVIQLFANSMDWFGTCKTKNLRAILAIFTLFLVMFVVAYFINGMIVPKLLGYDTSEVKIVNKSTWELLGQSKILGKSKLAYDNHFPMRFIISTDLCISFIITNYGWAPFIALTALIIMFVIKCYKICVKQHSMFGKFLGLSVLTVYVLQVVAYYLYNFGIRIISPLNLPLISYGNLAVLTNMILFGLLLSVFKSGQVAEI